MQRERQDSGGKLNNHVYQCTTALVNNNGYLFSAVFSALKYYLKPSAWFNNVLGPALQSEKFTKYGLQWADHWRYKDAVFCGGPTACTEEVFPSDRAYMISGQKIRNRKYQNVSLSSAFLEAHADCEPLQRTGFLGHFLNEIGNSMSTKTSWGPAWNFPRASRPSLLTVCSRPRHGECRIRGLHLLSAGGEELLLLLLIIWAN